MFSKRFARPGVGLGRGPWLEFIHRTNKATPGFFGTPFREGRVDGATHPNDYEEMYTHARVFFPGDDELTVVISATTPYGDEVLRAVDETYEH